MINIKLAGHYLATPDVCPVTYKWSNTLLPLDVGVGTAETPKRDDKDVLPRQKCLDALASLRHAKWFQVQTFNTSNYSPSRTAMFTVIAPGPPKVVGTLNHHSFNLFQTLLIN